jgi:predicted permease
MQRFWQDMQYGARLLLKKPGFSLIAIITLALGIGATTAIFSVVDAVILNPFPYRDHSRLYLIRQNLPKLGITQQFRHAGPEVVDVAGSGVFEQTAAWEGVSRNLTGGEQPERIAAAKVSTDFFTLLGIAPLHGRVILPTEQGPKGQNVLVISHGLWQRRFGGDLAAIGQKVALDDEPYTIIGVMPPSFRFEAGEAWFPFPFDFNGPRNARIFALISRLKSSVSPAQAAAQLEVIARQNEQSFIATNPEYAGRTIYLEPLSEFYYGMMRRAVLILFGAVALLLLIACANIANLLLARAMTRLNEVSIRAALGASRSALIQQLLAESLLLAVCGGILGTLLALWGVDALIALAPTGAIPTGTRVGIDSRVLIFSVIVTITTSLIFGLWPALQISKPALQECLKAGNQRTTVGHSNRRARSALIIIEVGLSLILLVMAGLMIRSFLKLTYINPGFETENLMTMRLNRSPAKSEGGKQNAAFFQQLIDRLSTTPGVVGVAATSHAQFVFNENWTVTVDNESLPSERKTQSIDTRTVSPNYFRVMGIPLVKGEFFSASDVGEFYSAQGAATAFGVVVINQTMARQFWPDQDPIGKRLKVGGPGSPNPWFTVKGVVADSLQTQLDTQVRPEVAFPMAQMAWRYRRMNLVIRTNVEPQGMVGAIQREIWAVDKDQPVYEVETFDTLVGRSIGERRFAMFLLALFAVLALVLASVGIYGVISYSVTERTHEIGLRIALGAQQGDVLKMVLRQGLRLALIGVAIGLAGALALTRLMSTLLYQVSTYDPLTFIGIALLLAGVAALACYLPARRAMKVDPMIALRYE